jgi:tetratricopeptide (TPR) repeat protein
MHTPVFRRLTVKAPLADEDLERLAYAAYLTGRDADCEDGLTRAHQAFLSRGEHQGAARCAFWLGFALLNSGDFARGGGWIARAQRILAEAPECVVHGYLLMPAGVRRIMEGDANSAHTVFCQAVEIGRRFGEADLIAMALHGCGRALMRLGKVAEGVTLLDEAMAAVTAGEVSPIAAGDIYCSVIEACHEIFDLRRAHQWTAALDRWCALQSDRVRFRGQCLIRRAEILQLQGAWPNALDEAQRACERLADPPQRAIGAAYYQWAELLRLRGEFAKAEDTYKQAGRFGRNPQPGLSLLRLVQGHVDVAATAIRNVLAETKERHVRARMLAAYVEIMLAAHDLTAAREGTDELSAIAAALDAPFLRAVSSHARGATLLVEGDERAALAVLREASQAWDDLEAPYEAARTRLLIGQIFKHLGDRDGANIELEAARQAFKRLGAAPDLARIEATTRGPASTSACGLSRRELEVLRALATSEYSATPSTSAPSIHTRASPARGCSIHSRTGSSGR